MELSVVLGSYNRKSFLKATIESVRNEKHDFDYEIIVIDGGSTDGSLEWLLKQKDIVTIVQHNRGTINGKPIKRRSWGYFMNLGFKAAQGKFILMLSDDCLVIPDAIKNGVNHFQNLLSEGRNIGAVAFYWRNWPEQQDFMVGLTFGRIFVNHGLYLRSALEKIKFVDEETFNFYHADGDLSLRLLEAEYEVIDSPDSYIEHFTHANLKVRQSNLILQQEDWAKYKLRWAKHVEGRVTFEQRIPKLYYDETKTYLKFPRSERTFLVLNEKITIIKKKLADVLRRFR